MNALRHGIVGVPHLTVPAGIRPVPPAVGAVAAQQGVRPVAFAGCTERFDAYYATALGETGRDVAARVLDRADGDLAVLDGWFGAALPEARLTVLFARLGDDARTFRVDGPDGPVLFCDVQTTPAAEPLQTSFLLALQLALLHTADRPEPVLAGALARVLATALYPRRILGFATAAQWLDGDRDDFLERAVPDSAEATGGAVLFLNYLHHQLGCSWAEITRADEPTLGGIARAVLGPDAQYKSFFELLDRQIPRGRPAQLSNDNPFPIATAATVNTSAPATSVRPVERRVCVLTGASGQLGAHLCRTQSERYDFVAVHRSATPVDGAFSVRADLSEAGACEHVVEAALERFGRIDVVVNAAVSSIVGALLDSDLAALAPQLLTTNVVVPLQLACAVARRFWADRVDENRARGRNVINVSSVSGRSVYAGEGQSVYAASKAALDHLTAHMALEFGAIGVRVNGVAPNSFPGTVPLERVAAAIQALDAGTSSGDLVVVDGPADHTVRLVAGRVT